MQTKINNIPFSLIVSYLVFLFFAIGPFIGFITRTFFDIFYNYVMILFCLVAVFLIYLNNLKINIPKYLGWFIAFTMYTILSDIFIVDINLDFQYFYSHRLLGTVLVLLIIENVIITRQFFRTLFITNHIVLFIAFVVIIIQQFGNRMFFVDPIFHDVLTSREYSNTRFPSIYSWIGSAGIMGLCFFPVLGLQISHHLKNNFKGVFYLFLIGAVVSFISKSRFIMLNYLFLLFLIPIYKGFNFKVFLKYTIIIILFAFSAYQGSKMIGLDTDRIIRERILEQNRGGMIEGSAGTRILAFKVFKKLYFKNPIIGKGQFHRSVKTSTDTELLQELHGRSSQIHVGYLSLFYFYGLIGGVIYLIFLYHISKHTYAIGISTKYWGPFFAIMQFLLTNLTGVYFHMFIIGLVLSMVYYKYYERIGNESEESELPALGFRVPDIKS